VSCSAKPRMLPSVPSPGPRRLEKEPGAVDPIPQAGEGKSKPVPVLPPADIPLFSLPSRD